MKFCVQNTFSKKVDVRQTQITVKHLRLSFLRKCWRFSIITKAVIYYRKSSFVDICQDSQYTSVTVFKVPLGTSPWCSRFWQTVSLQIYLKQIPSQMFSWETYQILRTTSLGFILVSVIKLWNVLAFVIAKTFEIFTLDFMIKENKFSVRIL